VSTTRLSVRNLPRDVDEKRLKKLLLDGILSKGGSKTARHILQVKARCSNVVRVRVGGLSQLTCVASTCVTLCCPLDRVMLVGVRLTSLVWLCWQVIRDDALVAAQQSKRASLGFGFAQVRHLAGHVALTACVSRYWGVPQAVT